jgi:hypothetical protein
MSETSRVILVRCPVCKRIKGHRKTCRFSQTEREERTDGEGLGEHR